MENIEESVFRDTLELGEYEASALDGLLQLGRTTAPNLAEATDIPNARIYGILEELGNAGYIKIIPGRPKEYEPKDPETILEQAKENRRQTFEEFRRKIDDIHGVFLEYYEPLYESAADTVSSTEELFYVVDVGDPSERQTREIYRQATSNIYIMTKSFEYLDSIESALDDALANDVDVTMLFTHPDHLSEGNADIQQQIRDRIDATFPSVDYRFSNSPMPWRGTIADPNTDDGTAIILVGEKNIPLHMRQAAITEDESFVSGLNQYFQLVWTHESVTTAD
jgi:sugar-specific transcriptional regulator TrmB